MFERTSSWHTFNDTDFETVRYIHADTHEAEMKLLRAENAALRAEVAGFRRLGEIASTAPPDDRTVEQWAHDIAREWMAAAADQDKTIAYNDLAKAADAAIRGEKP
jgi:hypothetical protein